MTIQLHATAHTPEGRPDDLHDLYEDSVACVRRLHETYGPTVAFRKAHQYSVFGFGEAANQVLLTRTDIFNLHSFFPGPKVSAQRRLNAGLFNLNGNKHKEHRRLIMPPFRKEALPRYLSVLTQLIDQCLTTLRPGKTLDLLAFAKSFSLRVTAEVLFGLASFEDGPLLDRLFEEWLALNHVVSFGSILPLDLPNERYAQLLQVADDMEQAVKKLVQQRIAEHKPGSADLFSPLVEAHLQGALSEVELIGEATHLFNASYHTTSYALTWTLFLLAQHPEVARPLADACAEERSMSLFDEDSLLCRALKESMRILPSVVYYARVPHETVEFAGSKYPRGTVFLGSHYVSHHQPTVFAEPKRFAPDRWLTEKPGPFNYIPFGGGARMCVGAPFAMQMLKLALTRILRKVRVTLLPGQTVNRRANLTLGPRDPILAQAWPADGLWTAQPVHGNVQESVTLPTPRTRREAA